MTDGPAVRLVSAGTGKSIPVPENITVAELRELAGVSDDVQLAFNGDVVHNEDEVEVGDGDTVVAAPRKVGHGS